MSTKRKVRSPVRQSMRVRPGLDRGRSWDPDPERMMMDAPKTKQNTLKHCCRSVATFMCTQVGVGGIIVCYALVGASVFIALETNDDAVTDILQKNVSRSRSLATDKLWKDYQDFQFNQTEWSSAADRTIQNLG